MSLLKHKISEGKGAKNDSESVVWRHFRDVQCGQCCLVGSFSFRATNIYVLWGKFYKCRHPSPASKNSFLSDVTINILSQSPLNTWELFEVSNFLLTLIKTKRRCRNSIKGFKFVLPELTKRCKNINFCIYTLGKM